MSIKMLNVRVLFSKPVVDRCVCKNVWKLVNSRQLCSVTQVVCSKNGCVPSILQTKMCKPYVNSLYFTGSNTIVSKVDSVTENDGDLFSDVDYDGITNGDEHMLKKFKILMLEVEVMRQEGLRVPSKLNTEQWIELLKLDTRSKRRKFLGFIWLREIKNLADERKKDERRQKNLERKEREKKEREESDHIIYGFAGSTIFLRVYDTTINMHYNNSLIQAMNFGQKLVIDCGYEEHMNNIESKNCGKQLMLMFAENRLHKDPYDLYFCNANPEYRAIKHFQKHVPTLYEPDFPVNITEKHYLDLFPKEKLVYLTPHCNNELKEYDHDAIYIIGAMIDKANSLPLSLAKAKSEGIKMASFPLDRYLDWQIGSKSLTLNQSLSIMLDIKCTGNWKEAFKHVPVRKITRRDDHRFLKKFKVATGKGRLTFPSLLDKLCVW